MDGITACGVRKAFGSGNARIDALRGVDFVARAGEITFLVGPSGCGKTTFISILAAMLTADAGDVSVFGCELGRMRRRDLTDFRMREIGFVFQQFNLLPALDAAENAAIPLIAQGVSASRARRRACEMLDRLGLARHVSRLPAQWSGGQQQRVAIARALIHEPRLVVCDEPTAALDAGSGRAVMELLGEVAVTPDRAAIVVTHDDRIFRFADQIAIMADGQIVRTERSAVSAQPMPAEVTS